MTFEEFKELLIAEIDKMTARGKSNDLKYERAGGMWKVWKAINVTDNEERLKQMVEIWDLVDERTN